MCTIQRVKYQDRAILQKKGILKLQAWGSAQRGKSLDPVSQMGLMRAQSFGGQEPRALV